MIDTEQTLDFLGQLYAGALPHGGVIEFRRVHNTEHGETHRVFSGSSDMIRALLHNWADPTLPYGVYFGVGLRHGQATRGTKDDVSMITALWADVDVVKLGWDMNLTLGMIKTHELAPSAIVNSGNGLHLYWALKNPILLSLHQTVSHVAELDTGIEQTMRQLAGVFGGDNTHDITRVLRLPGTFNTKNGKVKPVTVVHAPWTEYSLNQLIDGSRSTDRLLDNGTWLSRKDMLARSREQYKNDVAFSNASGLPPRKLTYKQIWELTKYGGGPRGTAYLGLDEAITRAVARLWLDMPLWDDDQVVHRVLSDVNKIKMAQAPHENWDWDRERREIADKLKRFKQKWGKK